MAQSRIALRVKQELKRCDKATLEILNDRNRSGVYYVFPEIKADCKTSLVLKHPKTESGLRSVYIPNTVASALLDLKKTQERQRRLLHGTYQEFGMVIAQPDGRPTEERLLVKSFKGLLSSSSGSARRARRRARSRTAS